LASSGHPTGITPEHTLRNRLVLQTIEIHQQTKLPAVLLAPVTAAV